MEKCWSYKFHTILQNEFKQILKVSSVVLVSKLVSLHKKKKIGIRKNASHTTSRHEQPIQLLEKIKRCLGSCNKKFGL